MDTSVFPSPPVVQQFDGSRLVVKDSVGNLVWSTEAGSTGDVFVVLEKDHDPTFYFSPVGLMPEIMDSPSQFVPADPRGFYSAAGNPYTDCEFKGIAFVVDYNTGTFMVSNVAWSYPHPMPGYEQIKGLAGISARYFTCQIDGHTVEAEEPSYYGGWVWPDEAGDFPFVEETEVAETVPPTSE